jgi:hypothetical protein
MRSEDSITIGHSLDYSPSCTLQPSKYLVQPSLQLDSCQSGRGAVRFEIAPFDDMYAGSFSREGRSEYRLRAQCCAGERWLIDQSCP